MKTSITVVVPVPHNQTPPELETYYRQVQADKDKGNILAPFTRGEATRSTATEVSALASYSSNEIGRLARERDAMIEELAKTYLDILRLYLEDSGDRNIINVDGHAVVVSPEDLKENWMCYAADSASTPISESVKKREYIQAVPMLQQLGVPPDILLKELVKTLGLPESFYEEAATAMKQAQEAATAPAGVNPDATDLDALTSQNLPLGPGNLQSIPGMPA
jgi:hypothetical protein